MQTAISRAPDAVCAVPPGPGAVVLQAVARRTRDRRAQHRELRQNAQKCVSAELAVASYEQGV